jgi:hypothetical protein
MQEELAAWSQRLAEMKDMVDKKGQAVEELRARLQKKTEFSGSVDTIVF